MSYMARQPKHPGLYKRGRRFYLAWYLPGKGMQHVSLVPAGETRATTNIEVARVIRQQILDSGLPASEIVAARKANGKPGGLPTKRPKLPETLEQLVAEFEKHNLDHAAPEQARRSGVKVRAFLAGQNIPSSTMITAATIDNHLRTQKAAGLSPSTRSKTRAAISGFCRYLVLRGLLQHNPAQAVRGPRVQLPPPRFLSETEYQAVLKLAKQHGIFAEVATALWSGMRCSEIRGLEYTAIDWPGRKITLLETKTKHPRAIPMKKELIEALENHALASTGKKHPARGIVFDDGGDNVRSAYWWRNALNPIRAEMPIFRKVSGTGAAWHLFRHTFVSRLVTAGVSLRNVAEWAGHTSIATTMRYAHLQPAYNGQIENA